MEYFKSNLQFLNTSLFFIQMLHHNRKSTLRFWEINLKYSRKKKNSGAWRRNNFTREEKLSLYQWHHFAKTGVSRTSPWGISGGIMSGAIVLSSTSQSVWQPLKIVSEGHRAQRMPCRYITALHLWQSLAWSCFWVCMLWSGKICTYVYIFIFLNMSVLFPVQVSSFLSTHSVRSRYIWKVR